MRSAFRFGAREMRVSDHWHRAQGLLIRSAIALPEVFPAAPGAPELVIELGPEARAAMPERVGDSAEEFVPSPRGGHVLHIEEAGYYWVREGRRITLTPAPGADAATLRLFLLGSALGMALHQRGGLVLHAAGVRVGGRALFLTGESAEGKSTLAAYMGRAGHAVTGDDTALLHPRGAGFVVWPAARVLRLWRDAVEHLGWSTRGLISVGARLDKFFVPAPEPAPDAPLPVGAIVELAGGSAGGGPRVVPLGRLEALRVIAENTYRPHYVRLLGREAAHFRASAALAAAVPVVRLCRPPGLERIDETIAELLAWWRAFAPEIPG